MPYYAHAINAYDTLQQGLDEPTEPYLHRAQDILEHIHQTKIFLKLQQWAQIMLKY